MYFHLFYLVLGLVFKDKIMQSVLLGIGFSLCYAIGQGGINSAGTYQFSCIFTCASGLSRV